MTMLNKRPGRTSSRDKILDAAAEIVTTQGVQSLTIDAVAELANVTKSGLIYHFRTREDLLEALFVRMSEQLDVRTRLSNKISSTFVSTKEALSVLLLEIFDMPEEQRRLLTNMIAAATAHPSLLSPLQALYKRDYGYIGQSKKPGKALLAAAAIDGFVLVELLNLYKFNNEQRNALREELSDLINQLP